MASGIYDRAKANLMNKILDLEADTIKVILLDDSHAFTSTHNVIGDVDANELPTAGGYTQKTKELAGKAVTQAATTKWDATDTAWAAATFSAWHAVLYDDDIGTDDLICSIDFGGEKSVAAGTFTIQWHGDGIMSLATV